MKVLILSGILSWGFSNFCVVFVQCCRSFCWIVESVPPFVHSGRFWKQSQTKGQNRCIVRHFWIIIEIYHSVTFNRNQFWYNWFLYRWFFAVLDRLWQHRSSFKFNRLWRSRLAVGGGILRRQLIFRKLGFEIVLVVI